MKKESLIRLYAYMLIRFLHIIVLPYYRITVVVLLLITVSSYHRITCLYAQEISTLYQDAMTAFYKKDYKKAISLWEEVLKVDPRQKNPQKLIEMARSKMAENIKPLTDEFNKFLERGEYLQSVEKLDQLLELDPTNPTWQSYREKLQKFTVNVAPSITEKGKIPQLLRKSVNSYLGREKDDRIAVLASRYAWQLEKSNKLSEKVFLFMDKEFSVVARIEVIDRVKTVVEQKQDTILDAIYDGKYEYAKMECELVISIEPENALAWKRLGSVYYALGKRTDAKACWQEAMRIAPDDSETKKFLQKIK
ncbi:MAG: tetratricopeptide repeat protein [Elusimicrobia bacterium]|nr:tetratricopeptide repeat protein [Elusimicrobiota bacterium]